MGLRNPEGAGEGYRYQLFILKLLMKITGLDISYLGPLEEREKIIGCINSPNNFIIVFNVPPNIMGDYFLINFVTYLLFITMAFSPSSSLI